jgi:hypothetical protein
MFLTTFWLTRRQQQSGDELSAQQVLLEPVTLQKVMEGISCLVTAIPIESYNILY